MTSGAEIVVARTSLTQGAPMPNTVVQCLKCTAPSLGLAEVTIELRTTAPAGVPRGTVVLCAGGFGEDFYTDGVGGLTFAQTLVALNYVVVEMKWHPAWLAVGLSPMVASARFEAMMRFLLDEATLLAKPIAGIGNSGGGGGLAYCLSKWGLGNRLALVIEGSSPPFVRLDVSCGSVNPTWNTVVAQLETTYNTAVNTSCNPLNRVASAGGLLCQLVAAMPAASLLPDSIVSPGAVLSYSLTKVHTIVGSTDCAEASLAHALYFHDQVTSAKALTFVAGGVHFIPTTAPGRAALLAALQAVF